MNGPESWMKLDLWDRKMGGQLEDGELEMAGDWIVGWIVGWGTDGERMDSRIGWTGELDVKRESWEPDFWSLEDWKIYSLENGKVEFWRTILRFGRT